MTFWPFVFQAITWDRAVRAKVEVAGVGQGLRHRDDVDHPHRFAVVELLVRLRPQVKFLLSVLFCKSISHLRIYCNSKLKTQHKTTITHHFIGDPFIEWQSLLFLCSVHFYVIASTIFYSSELVNSRISVFCRILLLHTHHQASSLCYIIEYGFNLNALEA
jgi:hypothetical protein